MAVCSIILCIYLEECAGCGKRYPHREMVEVHEDHQSLIFFEGDGVCASCAFAHGLL